MSVRGEVASEPILVKLVLLGSLGVGKSATIVRFLTRKFIGEYDPNIGSIYHHNIKLDQQDVNVHILDIGGELDCRRINEASSLWGDAFILIYAINDRESFINLASVPGNLANIRDQDNRPIITLVGNKKDAETERRVSTAEAAEFAASIPCSSREISASTSYTEVEGMFMDVIEEVVKTKRTRQTASDVRKGSYSKIKDLMDKHVTRSRAMSSLRETLDEYCVTRGQEDFIDKRDRSGTCNF